MWDREEIAEAPGHYEIVALPEGAGPPAARYRAAGPRGALFMFSVDHGVVGVFEDDPEHGVVLVGDRLVYAAVSRVTSSRRYFTVGYARAYDLALGKATAERPLIKKGRGWTYEGGYVWETPEEARAFLNSDVFSASGRHASDYAVYELELESEADVSILPHAADGVRRLLRDARVLRRVR